MGYIVFKLIDFVYSALLLLLIIRAIISWIPSINIYSEPAKSIIKITDIILDPIRNALYNMGVNLGIDISPIVAYFLLNILRRLLLEIIF